MCSTRIIWGSRASLLAGLVSVGMALAIGVPFGLLSGYVGGASTRIIMRLIDAMLAIPFLILAIALAAFLGPSLTNAMIAIGIAQIPIFARLTRGQVLAVKEEDYVEAADAVGNPHRRIVLRHIFPECHAADPGAGDSRRADRDHRRGEPVLSRPGAAAAQPELGQHAEYRARTSCRRRHGWRSGRGWRSSPWCCR